MPSGEGARTRSSIPRLQSQIDAIHAGRTSSLDLSDSALGERLTEVPDEIRGLEGLRTLVVGYSAIDRLPSWIGDLPHIEEIDTSHHPIAALPYRPNIRWSIHAETLILCSDALDPAQVYAKEYLQSKYCMFELTEIASRSEFASRVYPIVMPDAIIFDPISRLGYIKYWEEKQAALDDAMREVGQEYLQGIREELDLYAKIRSTIAGIMKMLADMNTLTPEIHKGTDFEQLYMQLAAALT